MKRGLLILKIIFGACISLLTISIWAWLHYSNGYFVFMMVCFAMLATLSALTIAETKKIIKEEERYR